MMEIGMGGMVRTAAGVLIGLLAVTTMPARDSKRKVLTTKKQTKVEFRGIALGEKVPLKGYPGWKFEKRTDLLYVGFYDFENKAVADVDFSIFKMSVLDGKVSEIMCQAENADAEQYVQVKMALAAKYGRCSRSGDWPEKGKGHFGQISEWDIDEMYIALTWFESRKLLTLFYRVAGCAGLIMKEEDKWTAANSGL